MAKPSTNKVRINISIDEETNDKLREFAAKGHTTVSQWITDRVWEKVSDEELKEKIFREK